MLAAERLVRHELSFTEMIPTGVSKPASQEIDPVLRRPARSK
jgi:hypothetical protein